MKRFIIPLIVLFAITYNFYGLENAIAYTAICFIFGLLIVGFEKLTKINSNY